MQSSLEETKFILKKYNITANKKLGQNFLISDEVINEIINASEVNKADLVIEIGPGLGTLTSKLLEKAGKVIAIELDTKMLKILQDRYFLYKNFVLLNADVLKVDLNTLIAENKGELNNVKIVANLPYYITTPIVMKLLEEKIPVDSITVMVQKEVADRLTALPGEKLSGAITYTVNYYAEASKIIFVDRNNFIPASEVAPEVIKLKIRQEPAVNVKNEKVFFRLIKESFSHRRKTLVNGLENSGMFKDKEQIKQLLEKMNLETNVRGENLSINQFAELSNLIAESI